MSRWLDNYEANSFHINWENFKEKYYEFNIKEISDTKIIDEYNRLGKVINFLDSYLKLADPELSRENILSDTTNYLNNAINYFGSFIKNQRIDDLKRVNYYMDDCVENIKKLNILLPKISSKSVSSMLKNYSDTIKEVLEEINLEKIKNDTKEIYDLKDELIDNEDNIKDKIKNLSSEIENMYEKIEEFYSEFLIDNSDNTSIKTVVLNEQQNIIDKINTTKKNLTEANIKIEELEKFYVKIYGSFDEQQNKRIGGLEQELKTKQEELDKIEQKYREKFNALIENIESLLPGATSIGLAKAYSDERKKFKRPIILWNIAFMVSISSLLLFYIFRLDFIDNSVEGMIKTMLKSFPIALPLIWFAIYASKRRSENQRLEQEYTHKETFAKSYMGYKKQISELKDEQSELSVKLLNEIIESVSYNASQTLDKKHGDETISKEILSSIKDTLSNIKGIKNDSRPFRKQNPAKLFKFTPKTWL